MDSDDKRSRTAHWESLGVERELLCTIETDRVFPATLHYLLGPGVRLIKKLEGLCLTKDLCEHGFGYEMDSFDEKVRNGLIERRGLEIDKVRQALRDERRYERDVEGMISAIGTDERFAMERGKDEEEMEEDEEEMEDDEEEMEEDEDEIEEDEMEEEEMEEECNN
ncbi:hypothetical protein PRIPAC_94412 [Pristionchus pacificus]|uniref:Uncharacterized protein n=1 Tax=Pristionchus pacificus TaxID=54126 RepID=A0A2A6C9E4_PRIPA|nr:hypothetical protein PRIPAC_94412 [Pristionchus pacificus]|eukprot:PDM74779.1 hypothetical protein PRIPAC_43730 [Pristionchus pacificus]